VARRAPSVERAVAVLNHLAQDPQRRWSLSDLARDLDLSKATAHAVLTSLVQTGYLVRDEDKSYSLGPALIAVGDAAQAAFPGARVAQRQMDELAARFDLEVVASTAIGDEIVILARSGNPRPLGIDVRPGQRLPLVPPLGTVFVAWAAADRIDRWLSELGPDATAADRDAAREALGIVRDRRYAVALGGERQQRIVEQVTSRRQGGGGDDYGLSELAETQSYRISQIGAPVFGPDGAVVLGLFLIGFRGEIAAAEVPAYAQALLEAADEVTAALRGRVPVG